MRQLLRIALIASTMLALPAAAQEGNRSRPPLNPADAAAIPRGNDAYPGTMTLHVDATDVARAVFRVRQTIPVRPGALTLRYPEWLPGKHAPRGPIGDLAGLTITSGNRTIGWRRDPRDVYAFNLTIPAGVRSIDVAFDYLSPTREAEGRIVMTPAMLNLQWDAMILYPGGWMTRNIPVRPSVTLPQGWTGYAALDGARTSGNRIDYGVTDVETLVDSPMFAGAHARSWDLGHNVRLNVVADDAQSLEATPAQIDAHRALVEEAVRLFGTRHFDRYEFLLALTEELGGIGLEHHRSSENSRETDYFTEWDQNGSERGLLPHELTHSWNGKYRRPDRLWTPDYSVPMDNRLLWVYEGQTSFWDLVLGARSGLQSREMVLAEWARYAATYQAQPGRAWRSVEDTTLDPIMAARRPRPFPSYTRTEDYYNEGSLVWLEVEAQLRQLTNGARGMDDFAAAFFGGRDGDWGTVTYDFNDVVATLNRIAPHDWAGFLSRRIMEPGQPAPLAGLERGGYRLVFRDTPNVYDAERMRETRGLDLMFSLGLMLNKDGEVTSVLWDSVAAREGLVNGTRIVAVNGTAYSDDRMRAAITAAADGRTPITLLVQRGGRYRTVTPAWTGGLRYPHLERIGTGEAGIDRLLTPRRPIAPTPAG